MWTFPNSFFLLEIKQKVALKNKIKIRCSNYDKCIILQKNTFIDSDLLCFISVPCAIRCALLILLTLSICFFIYSFTLLISWPQNSDLVWAGLVQSVLNWFGPVRTSPTKFFPLYMLKQIAHFRRVSPFTEYVVHPQFALCILLDSNVAYLVSFERY